MNSARPGREAPTDLGTKMPRSRSPTDLFPNLLPTIHWFKGPEIGQGVFDAIVLIASAGVAASYVHRWRAESPSAPHRPAQVFASSRGGEAWAG